MSTQKQSALYIYKDYIKNGMGKLVSSRISGLILDPEGEVSRLCGYYKGQINDLAKIEF